MKKILVTLLLSSYFMVNAYSQENRNVASFSEVHISGAFDVYLTQGSEEKVKIEADQEDLEDIITEVKSGKLYVKARKGANNVKGDIYITFKKIDAIHSSGASYVKSENTISSGDFEVHSSGAGKLSLALDVSDIEIHSSGAGTVELEGKAKNQDISLSGAGEIRAYDLVGGSAKVRASGAGNIQLHVNGTLNVSSSGASTVRYKGNPEVESVNISGAGSVRKG